MELAKTEIQSLEQIILHSEIPYEDVKIELLDRLATSIEVRMEGNPELSFSDALRLSSTEIKEDIIGIQKDIEHREIKKSIVEAFGFRNLKSSVIFMFFAIATYGCFLAMGTIGAPIVSSIIAFTTIGIIVSKIRASTISSVNSLNLKYRKQNYWIPLLLVAAFSLAVSTITIEIINTFCFWSYINNLILVSVAIAYGFLFKVIIHISVFWIDDTRNRTEIDKKILKLV